MTIEVKSPAFEYLLEDPTQVRDQPEEIGVWVVDEKKPKWKGVIVSTYNGGLPIPKDGEILYKYQENRGYLLS